MNPLSARLLKVAAAIRGAASASGDVQKVS
jgi:hypothetical protein